MSDLDKTGRKEERFSAHHLDNVENCGVYPYTSAESQLEILQAETKNSLTMLEIKVAHSHVGN